MMSQTNFDNIYTKYSPTLYGIALKINADPNKAEQIFMGTFKKIFENDISKKKHPDHCLTLIRLIVNTAKEIFPLEFKGNLKLNQFENTPLLNQIICDQVALQEICAKKNVKHKKGLQMIRNEISNVIEINSEKAYFKNFQIQQLNEEFYYTPSILLLKG